jgi:hypothetical protein
MAPAPLGIGIESAWRYGNVDHGHRGLGVSHARVARVGGVRAHPAPANPRAVSALTMFALAGALFAVGIFLGLLLCLELGRRIGRRRLARDAEADRAGAVVLEGAVFGLLGLLIAFTFSGAAARFDARRQLLVEEANAIGTAYLRLDVLPSDAQPPLRDRFRRYVETRRAVYRKLPDLAAAEVELAKATALQGEIWSLAVKASQNEDSQPARGLVLPALNAMIEIATTRTLATRIHPPIVIFAALLVLVLGSAVLAGSDMAGGETRDWLHILAFAATMALALYVILELEFPRLGLVRVDAFDQVLGDVLATMR